MPLTIAIKMTITKNIKPSIVFGLFDMFDHKACININHSARDYQF